jgi:hypothetical protein
MQFLVSHLTVWTVNPQLINVSLWNRGPSLALPRHYGLPYGTDISGHGLGRGRGGCLSYRSDGGGGVSVSRTRAVTAGKHLSLVPVQVLYPPPSPALLCS